MKSLTEKYDHFIYHGDVYACLHQMDDNSVECAITSPPYWAQRDYEFDDQIGNEATLDEYIAKLVLIFSMLRQKLTTKGIFYLNIGDKYLSKYGNSSLGMIPYKLAYQMVQNGWFLEDIIIWYKPNHMPSSVKNRFTNTYEPVFVFANSENNYYQEYKERTPNHHNYITIALQPVQFAHLATYPEKLVEKLLEFGIPRSGLVLDPFGGSGTTCKAVQNINLSQKTRLRSVMIEAQDSFVSIIRDRCKLSADCLRRIDPIAYGKILDTNPISLTPKLSNKVDIETQSGDGVHIAILPEGSDLASYLSQINDPDYFDSIEDDHLLFVELPNHKIESIIAFTVASSWIIRNMLIVIRNNDWVPIFMLVKDVKSLPYRFNLDAIRISHTTDNQENWHTIDFRGYKVTRSNNFFKQALNGLIIEVISRLKNGIPHWVAVKWDDETISVEEIKDPQNSKKYMFSCPKCRKQLKKYYSYHKSVNCAYCNVQLWKNVDTIPRLYLGEEPIPEYMISADDMKIQEKDTRRNYNGKFKDTAKINMGQSPGARASVSEMIFSFQRMYDVWQPMICDYLNLYRIQKGISKNDLTRMFSEEYKHTVGHWLRKDMGGSLPKKEDLLDLERILELDPIFVRFINRMGLKLQTIIANSKGKNPGDFLAMDLVRLRNMLKKLGEQS